LSLSLLSLADARRAATVRVKPHLWREVLLNGAAVLLLGSFVIGLLTGERGMTRLSSRHPGIPASRHPGILAVSDMQVMRGECF